MMIIKTQQMSIFFKNKFTIIGSNRNFCSEVIKNILNNINNE